MCHVTIVIDSVPPATSAREYLWNVPCLCMPSYVGPSQDNSKCDAGTYIWDSRLAFSLLGLLGLLGGPVDLRGGALHPRGIQRLDIGLGPVRHDPRRVDLRVGVVVVLLDVCESMSDEGPISWMWDRFRRTLKVGGVFEGRVGPV